MEQEPLPWLVHWFTSHIGLSPEEIKTKTNQNYFELGWIDSLQFITFILELEKDFDVRFSNEDFQDRDFSTLEGLARFVSKKARAQHV